MNEAWFANNSNLITQIIVKTQILVFAEVEIQTNNAQGKVITLILKDIHHVPNCTTNILSVFKHLSKVHAVRHKKENAFYNYTSGQKFTNAQKCKLLFLSCIASNIRHVLNKCFECESETYSGINGLDT